MGFREFLAAVSFFGSLASIISLAIWALTANIDQGTTIEPKSHDNHVVR